MAKGSKAFENPLIPHARMRAMYRALVETRALAPRLGRARRLPRNQEACWVGTAIGLNPGDLTSDPRGTAAIDHIRSAGVRKSDSSPTASALKRIDARPLAPAESTFERLLCATGAAMALKSCGNAVIMAYTAADDLSPAGWKRLLAVCARADANASLPLILVVTPARRSALDLDKLAGNAAREQSRTPGRRLPVLPVDAADAVALYRAAQESIGRARATGAAVLIECVATGSDPIQLLGAQLIAKKICSQVWCARVASSLSS